MHFACTDKVSCPFYKPWTNWMLSGHPYFQWANISWDFTFQRPFFPRWLASRAHRDWPLRPKIENRDSHTWIFIGNWILMWVCFLHFFDLSTSSAAKMRFYFLPFLQGKRAQNRPKNPQNWNLAKIGLKSDNFMK